MEQPAARQGVECTHAICEILQAGLAVLEKRRDSWRYVDGTV